MSDIEQRLRRTTELLVKLASISEVTMKIASEVDENLSKQQKEFFLRQQLAAIQKELSTLGKSRTGPGSDLDDEDNDADDLAEIKHKIEAMEQGSEERKTGGAEYKRLKRIPQGSAENGVIRNYVSNPLTHMLYIADDFSQLEWLTSLPWPSATNASSTSIEILKDKQFLTKAREQLEADHYGLEKIKKRLIEYLAVVRLKELAAEAEAVMNDNKALVLKSEIDAAVQSVPPTIPSIRRTVKGPILLYVLGRIHWIKIFMLN